MIELKGRMAVQHQHETALGRSSTVVGVRSSQTYHWPSAVNLKRGKESSNFTPQRAAGAVSLDHPQARKLACDDERRHRSRGAPCWRPLWSIVRGGAAFFLAAGIA